jgi:alpha-L-rhamnosidase
MTSFDVDIEETYRFSSNTYFDGINRWERGRVWADYSRRLFNDRPVSVSLTAVQACSLLGSLAFAESDTNMKTLYSALANRMVQLLDLPHRLSANRVQREIEIRGSTPFCENSLLAANCSYAVWWTVWMMDTWSSAGARLPKQINASSAYIKPMEEIAFERLEPGTNFDESLESEHDFIALRDSGLWTQMIPLTEIFTHVNELNDRTVQHPNSKTQLYENVQSISNMLDSWLLCLPVQLHNNLENIQYFTEQGHGRTFVALHLGYHHHAQLLYYQFLHATPGHSLNKALANNYAKRCKSHATALSNLLWIANSTPGCECLWMLTGHLLVISSSIHLHTLLFETSESLIANAKLMLERNFEMLIRLRNYWPCLDMSMSRLRAFHNACRASMNTSFDMDQWMLQFLQRYSTPIDDKVQFPQASIAGEVPNLPFSADSADSSAQVLWLSADGEANAQQLLQRFTY